MSAGLSITATVCLTIQLLSLPCFQVLERKSQLAIKTKWTIQNNGCFFLAILMDSSQQPILPFSTQQEEGRDVCVDGSQDYGLISLIDCSMVQQYLRFLRWGSPCLKVLAMAVWELLSAVSQEIAVGYCWLNVSRWSIMSDLQLVWKSLWYTTREMHIIINIISVIRPSEMVAGTFRQRKCILPEPKFYLCICAIWFPVNRIQQKQLAQLLWSLEYMENVADIPWTL